MKRIFVLFVILTILSTALSFAAEGRDHEALISEAGKLKAGNQYTKAMKLLDEGRISCRARGDMEGFRKLSQEIWEMEKVIAEYGVREGDLIALAEKMKLPLTQEDVKRLIAENSLENMNVDGEKRYFSSCLINVFYRHPSFKGRFAKIRKANKTLLDKYRWIIFRSFPDPDQKAYSPYSNPQVFEGEQEIELKQERLPSRGLLRLWVPYPVSTTPQTDIRLLHLSHPEWLKSISDPDSEIGCLYFEIPLPLKKKEVEITTEFQFTVYTTGFAIDPARVGAFDTSSQLYSHYKRSDENCTVTPEIKALAEKIAAGEKNPYLASKKLYEYVVDKIDYSLMPHLSLGALGKPESVYVLEHGYGDCGAQSLFFSALCRSIGIPARCCGGMQLAPDMNSYHFWAQVYIPGYGWIPVDTSIAQAVLGSDGLTQSEAARIRDFFFGSMDPYRFYIQTETDLDFYPPKQAPRTLRLAFQMPDASCDEAIDNPAFYIEYETDFERIR